MGPLFYSKVCIVFTVGLAGLNLHQLISSYEYVKEKIDELNAVIEDGADLKSLNVVSTFFYILIPAGYLFILAKADVLFPGIALLFSKFLISAILGFWTQARVFGGAEYTRALHFIGKFDNLLNLLMSVLVAYFIIYPPQDTIGP